MFRFLLLLIAVDNPLLVGKQHFQGNLVVLPFVAFSYTKIPSPPLHNPIGNPHRSNQPNLSNHLVSYNQTTRHRKNRYNSLTSSSG